MAPVTTLATRAWLALLAVLLLGPALGPGYVLSYDMVWVPDLSLTRDARGVGTGLPRAVPSDAAVAVLDQVLPGAVLQKLVLVGAVLGGALGLARLLAPAGALAALVGGTAYLWNPLVVERLVIGHWPLLLGYAAAPWLVLAAMAWQRGRRVPLRLWWLLPLASLSASTGLLSAVLLVALAARREVRRWVLLAGMVAAANAPWVVSGLLHAASAGSDPAASEVFALHDEGGVPGPLAALTLGGIWNSQVVPEGRTGAVGWIALVAVVGLALAGLPGVLRLLPARAWWGLVGCWAAGWGLASVTWVAPQLLGVVAGLPGGGVLRDGSRALVLCAPLLCLGVGAGAARVVAALPAPARLGAGVALVALPIAVLPGVAWGVGGRLDAVPYPSDFAAARTALRAADPGGEVLLLPFTSYRAPAWNGGRPVLDPTGRYLGVDVVQSDRLAVGGRELAGEDPRAALVREVLTDAASPPTPQVWAGLGLGAAAVARDAGAVPEVGGTPVHTGELLDVLVLQPPGQAPQEQPVPTSWVLAMAAAWSGFLLPPWVATLRAISRLDRRRPLDRAG